MSAAYYVFVKSRQDREEEKEKQDGREDAEE
jgi:hypothetical protein